MKAQRRLITLLAAMTAFLLLFAACGGGGDDDDGVASIDDDSSDQTDDEDDGGGGNGEPSVDDAEFEDAMLEYAQCMRDNGVDMPDPDFDGEGGVMIGGGPADGADDTAAREAFEAADEACQGIMDEVAPDMNLSPEEQAEMQDQFLEVAQCMRDKGHDMPDPEVGEDGSVMMRTEAADGAEGGSGPPGEEFQKDNEDCMEQAGLDRRGPGASEDDADDEEDDE